MVNKNNKYIGYIEYAYGLAKAYGPKFLATFHDFYTVRVDNQISKSLAVYFTYYYVIEDSRKEWVRFLNNLKKGNTCIW